MIYTYSFYLSNVNKFMENHFWMISILYIKKITYKSNIFSSKINVKSEFFLFNSELFHIQNTLITEKIK